MLPGHKTRTNPRPAKRLPPVQVDLPAPRFIGGAGAHGLGQNDVQFGVAVEIGEPDTLALGIELGFFRLGRLGEAPVGLLEEDAEAFGLIVREDDVVQAVPVQIAHRRSEEIRAELLLTPDAVLRPVPPLVDIEGQPARAGGLGSVGLHRVTVEIGRGPRLPEGAGCGRVMVRVGLDRFELAGRERPVARVPPAQSQSTGVVAARQAALASVAPVVPGRKGVRIEAADEAVLLEFPASGASAEEINADLAAVDRPVRSGRSGVPGRDDVEFPVAVGVEEDDGLRGKVAFGQARPYDLETALPVAEERDQTSAVGGGDDVEVPVAVDVADRDAAVVDREVRLWLAALGVRDGPRAESALAVPQPDPESAAAADPGGWRHDVHDPVAVEVDQDE